MRTALGPSVYYWRNPWEARLEKSQLRSVCQGQILRPERLSQTLSLDESHRSRGYQFRRSVEFAGTRSLSR